MSEHEKELTQDQLDGLVDPLELKAAVGWESHEEKEAARGLRSISKHRVIPIERLAKIRTDDGEAFADKAYVSRENALMILPPTYGEREIDGATYPALHSIPTTYIRAWLPQEVEAMRDRLADFRQRKEAERKERAERRSAILERIASGDDDVRLVYEVKGYEKGRGTVWIQQSV